MAHSGWHQSALDRAHEAAATIIADREAAQNAVAEHLAATAVPPSTTNGS